MKEIVLELRNPDLARRAEAAREFVGKEQSQ